MLTVAWYRFRATFGRRWGGYLSLVLLVGLVGGLAMGAVAGARRTQSSFPTYLASTDPSDINLPTALYKPGSANSTGADLAVTRRIAHLPRVRRVETEYQLNALPLGSNGFPISRTTSNASIIDSLNQYGSVDGLTDIEFQMFWMLLVVAGNETTRNALSGSVIALHEHGLWTLLAQHPEHLPTATEELIRYVSPVQQFRRTATRDTTLGDQRVRAGDKVVIWFGAANRDPEVFADPNQLDLVRDPNPHVAFGTGAHFCLGAHLARLEMQEMLRRLLNRAPDMTIGTPTRMASNFINGVSRLPARLGAPAADVA